MFPKKTQELLSQLTLLIVDDEEFFRVFLGDTLSPYFKNTLYAENGFEGIKLHKESRPDIIISDNMMPGLSGLEMIQEIRASDEETPIIMATAFIDLKLFMEAVNLGVAQFLPKPIDMKQLFQALNQALSKTIIKNLELKSQKQEIALLKLKDFYNKAEQENALQKELNLIENDLYLKKIDLEDEQWILNVCFEPLEILSGDSYSIKKIKKDRFLLVIIDGMGKGLSPSITSALSIAYINDYLRKLNKKHFDLKTLISSYKEFISPKLLEDEMVAISFLYYKFDKQSIEYGLFGMPAIHIEKNRKISKIKSNNPPLCKYMDSLKTNFFSIKKVDKIAVFSDGLSEAITKDGKLYADKLPSDLKESRFLKSFLARFRDSCPTLDDDLNVALLVRIPKNKILKKRFCILSKREKIEELTFQIENLLQKEGFTEEFVVNYITIFTELISNAYEHGNLGISFEEKREKIEDGEYDSFLKQAEKKLKKRIVVRIKLLKEDEKSFVLTSIEDSGNGFDTKILENLMFKNKLDPSMENGRGVLLSKALAEEISFSHDGNEVIFIQQSNKIIGGSNGN